MSALSSLEFGKRLRAEREHLRLSLRQVQELSRGIAEQRKNHEYYIAHSSLADIESGKRQHPDLRQRIGSITKTMVGLCVMALADEGRLSLDDRLINHVPEVAFHGDGGAITLWHLLTHTSGIGEVPTLEDMRRVDDTLWACLLYTSDAADE